MDDNHTVVDALIDELIDSWSAWESSARFYVRELLPAIVRGDEGLDLTDKEIRITSELRSRLGPDEWRDLPRLVLERRLWRERSSQRQAMEKRLAVEAERAARAAAEREERERARRLPGLRARIARAMSERFLELDGLLAADPDAHLLDAAELDAMKASFVQKWAAETLGLELDHEQAAAVASVHRDTRVVARAGSGKTRTLVTRAVFLIRHCGVPPRAVLLLAFNRRAAEEMKERLDASLAGDLPHVMTFHALAYALVHPEEELIYDRDDQPSLSREIQEVIDEHIRSDEFGPVVRSVMLTHFREDWERIVDGGFDLGLQDFVARRRALPRETLAGEFVKSHGEKVIANALFENGIDYKYERNFRWDGVNYRPDFTINLPSGGGVVIEYFGLEGDPDYDTQSERKRRFWASRDHWTLLEYGPSDVVDAERFRARFTASLSDLGVPSRPRSDEEIWELVRGRAVDRFTSAMRTLVGRCRMRGLSQDELVDLIKGHTCINESEAEFLRLGLSVHDGYRCLLSEREKEDFDGLMWRAVDQVRAGHTRFSRDGGREQGDLGRLDHVLVDEFQDFSEMFYGLLAATRASNPSVEFFCVGDDWQAINAFAGSDLRYFDDFADYFPSPSLREIHSNYRSPARVVELGNAVMAGRGTPARSGRRDAGMVTVCDLSRFQPTQVETDRHGGDEITPAVLRLVHSFTRRGLDVALLSRRNGLPWYVNRDQSTPQGGSELDRFLAGVRSYLPEELKGRVTISTTHKFKGLESSAVIILDGVARSYPLIHPTWIFIRVFGESVEKIEDEERRLFYVAVTRAQHSLAIITEASRESPFLDDASGLVHLEQADWGRLLPPPSVDGQKVEVRIFNAFEVRDDLKQRGYRFQGGTKCWAKSVPSEAFDLAELRSEPWYRSTLRVEVYDEHGRSLTPG